MTETKIPTLWAWYRTTVLQSVSPVLQLPGSSERFELQPESATEWERVRLSFWRARFENQPVEFALLVNVVRSFRGAGTGTPRSNARIWIKYVVRVEGESAHLVQTELTDDDWDRVADTKAIPSKFPHLYTPRIAKSFSRLLDAVPSLAVLTARSLKITSEKIESFLATRPVETDVLLVSPDIGLTTPKAEKYLRFLRECLPPELLELIQTASDDQNEPTRMSLHTSLLDPTRRTGPLFPPNQ